MKAKSKLVFTISVFFLLLGGYFLEEIFDFNKIVRASPGETNYSETWTQTSGIYSTADNNYKSGIPSDNEIAGSCGFSGWGLWGGGYHNFSVPTGWQISGAISGNNYLENWQAVNGFFSLGSLVMGNSGYSQNGIYFKGVPLNDTCGRDNAGFFSPSQWLVSGTISGVTTNYYQEVWQAIAGKYIINQRFKNGLPPQGTRCLDEGYSGSCGFFPSQWQITGQISDTPPINPIQKHYFVTQDSYLLSSGRYEWTSDCNGWMSCEDNSRWMVRLKPQPADQFCNTDPNHISGKTYRAVFVDQLEPSGVKLQNTVFGSGEAWSTQNYLQNSSSSHALNSAYCTTYCPPEYYGPPCSYSTKVFGKYLKQNEKLGSINDALVYSSESDSCGWDIQPNNLITKINQQNLKLLCVEE